MKQPEDPSIFHITHINNLPGIIAQNGLWCDREVITRSLSNTNIGLRRIKQRRMARAVTTEAGGTLGEYVPFNFCPRSVMLYAIHRGHDDWSGGQNNIIHLVSRFSIASSLNRDWLFTDRHAEVGHALHFDDPTRLDQVPWHVMDERYWADVKEERQAEFLVRTFFPWTAVTSIAVIDKSTQESVNVILSDAMHRPEVYVKPNWYY